ncbi:MAG: hypothetical protein FWE76_04290, partial [Symbiobacteriaceae bacterium]|nr:hypothetical protein [Symbiobacteriaceae bacterium]
GWDGQNGTGAAGMRSQLRKPVAVMIDIVAMSAGAAHSLVVSSDGALYAFGRNRHGELGNGNTTSQTRPQLILGSGVAAVSAGDRHSLAVMSDGSLLAWGDSYAGQLGNGDTRQILAPVKIMDDVTKAYAGRVNSFAITSDGTLWGWGRNVTTLLFEGADAEHLQLQPLRLMNDVREVAIGAAHLLILQNDGSLWVAGENWLGQLGLPVPSSFLPIQALNQVKAIAAGGWHSLAISSSGDLLAWGDNTYGQLGNMTFEPLYAPTIITVNDLPPSVLFNGDGAGWQQVRPVLAVDRIVLPITTTFDALDIPYRITMDAILEFSLNDLDYIHLIGSRIFFVAGKRAVCDLVTLNYSGVAVLQAFSLSAFCGLTVHWDPTAQLLILDE